MTPINGPVGTTVTVTAAASGFTGDTPGAIFTTAASCPGTYNTTAPNIAAGNGTKISGTQASFTVPSTLTLGTSGVPKSYNVCAYAGTVVGTSLSVNDPPTAFNLLPGGTVSPATTASGGGGTVTITMPTTAAVIPASPGVAFVAANATCPATYGVATATSATVTRTSTTVLSAAVPTSVLANSLSTGYTACIYSSALSGGTPVATSNAGAYNVTLPAVSLNQPTAPPSVSPNNLVNLTISSTSNIFTGVTAPVAVFTSSPTASPTTCSALYVAPGGTYLASVRKVANNKAAVTVPAGPVVIGSAPTPYNLCIYSSNNTTTGKLLSVVTYTVANVPTLTAVTPNAGSALGGQTITVTGSNFPSSGITATLGGAALTQVTPVDANTFTAVTPQHATGSATLMISTALGSDSLSGAFSYQNSISISPNTAPSSVTAQDVDVQGTGFLDLVWTGASAAKVYLTDGVYNGRAGTSGTTKANGPVAGCGNVIVISDNELVCNVNLTGALNAAGTATFTSYRAAVSVDLTASSNVVAINATAVALGVTFNPNDIGKPISDAATNIPAGTTIVAITSPTTAVMSAAATALPTITNPVSVSIGTQVAGTAVTGTSGEYTITATTPGSFTQADVGKAVTVATGLGSNTVITGIDPAGTVATLSVANSGAVSGSATLSSGNPVPDGAYNMVVVSDAALNAANTDTTYKQTVISSGSTFTVAPF
jgi:hypothetical protein